MGRAKPEHGITGKSFPMQTLGKEHSAPKAKSHWVDSLPPVPRLLVCIGGVFFFYIVHDYVQEAVFHVEGFHFGWFMTLFELGTFVVSATLQLRASGGSLMEARSSASRYCLLTLMIAATQGFGSAAINYVNYPVKVVCKSSKLIPTMMLGVLISRKYSFLEYVAAIALCIGVVGFTLVDAHVSPDFSPIGVLFLGIAVVGDALTANMQEHILQQQKRPVAEMVSVSNGLGMLVVLVVCMVTGELTGAIALCMKEPSVLGMLLVQAGSGYLGVGFYLALVSGFGGATAITVTTCRKVATIIISFFAFPKPFDMMYVYTAALVGGGIWLSVVAKRKPNGQRS